MTGGAVSADVTKIPKPVLRGLHNATIGKNLIVSSVLMAIAGGAYYYRNQGRIHDYAEFYKHYDADKSFNHMRNSGLLQSVRPDGEEE